MLCHLTYFYLSVLFKRRYFTHCLHFSMQLVSCLPFVTAAPFGPAMGLFMTPYHMLPGVYSGIPGMLGAAMPYPGYHGFPFPSPAAHRSPSPNVVTEEDFQKMIQIHRKRRLGNEVHYCI